MPGLHFLSGLSPFPTTMKAPETARTAGRGDQQKVPLFCFFSRPSKAAQIRSGSLENGEWAEGGHTAHYKGEHLVFSAYSTGVPVPAACSNSSRFCF